MTGRFRFADARDADAADVFAPSEPRAKRVSTVSLSGVVREARLAHLPRTASRTQATRTRGQSRGA